MRVIRNRFFPLLILLLLIFPTVNSFIPIIKDIESSEKREENKKPEFDINFLDTYPHEFEAYYNDKFLLRNKLISYYSYFKFNFLGISPMPDKVIMGKSSWMFLNKNTLPNKREINKLTNAHLLRIYNELIYRKSFCDSLGIGFYLAIVPSKPNLYYEKLDYPFFKKQHLDIPTTTDQVVQLINKDPGIKVIDLKNSLQPIKDSIQLFFKYDHHWNEHGGFYAAKYLLGILNNDYPNKVGDLQLYKYNIDSTFGTTFTITHMLGLDNYYSEPRAKYTLKPEYGNITMLDKKYTPPNYFSSKKEYEIRTTSNNDSLLNCLIIRDSFAKQCYNFLSYGFNNTVYIWDGWRYQRNEDIILNEDIDVVIVFMWDSFLQRLDPDFTK